jgi:CheY-like chemotaxis protein
LVEPEESDMMRGAGTILLVEDNEDDAFFFERELKIAGIYNQVLRVEDGQKAIEYLSGKSEFADRSKFPVPGLIFLDLKLPLVSGLEVLEWIRSTPEYQRAVVVVLTSSNEPKDFNEAQRLGADSYKVKPLSGSQFLELVRVLKLDSPEMR